MTYSEWYKEYVEGEEVDKELESDIITSKPLEINIQLFARKPSDFPTIRLPKDEYAHVTSEIATNISPKQQKMRTFNKAIGNHIYRVENNGFGNYRIIGRRKIK